MSKLFRLLLCVLLVAGMGGMWLRQGSASTSMTTDKQAAGLEIPTTEAMDLWQDVDVATLRAVQQQEVNWINPVEYRSVALNELSLAGILNRAPMEFSAESMSSRVVMTFPMPDGTNQRFAIVESPIMGPELAAEWSHIKTYAGQGIDDPTATIRFDVSPVGLRGMILSAEDTVYIDPAKRGGTNLYMTYSKSKYVREDKTFDCQMTSPELGDLDQHDHKFSVTPNALPTENPIRLRTYRLVVCGNAEYGNAAGGGVLANAQAAVVTTINRVSGLYERDMAVRLSLVKSYVFVGSTTADPFTNGANTSATTAWSENTTYINNNWGAANYDVGHFFSTGAGGAGDIGQVCVAGRKANGATGQSAPTGDGYDIDYVAHELGHQFGGRHTFNSGGTNGCNSGARDTTGPLPNAIEPGSGSTVMAYASICGSQDLQLIGQGEGANGQVIAGASDDYFHSTSVERIINNVTSGTSTCGAQTVTTNNRPTVDAGLNYTIPVNTPFTLTAASASDPDGDTLTYCWEQMDQGSAITSGSLPNPDLGNNAIFRSWQPSTSSSRIFPERSVILNDSTKESRPGRHAKSLKGEKLPTTSRTMNFRCTVRDNRTGGGGVSWDAMTVTTTTGAGPFAVSAPNTNVSWANNTSQTVTWSVANTSAAPVSCANVKISLSTDGGVTFPTVLAATTPNDGTQAVTIPAGITSTTARIKVEAVGNIFFDISNTNFTITAGSSCTFSVSPTTVSATAAGGASSVNVTAGTGCAWTATSNAAWITTSASGSGNGTASFTVAANSTTSTRTGTLTVAGQTVTVNQAAGTATCTYSVSPTSVSATAAGGASSVSVTAGTGCAWTATSNAAWITTSASGSGNGTASFTVAANSGTTSRTGTLTVAGQTVTVTQAGNSGSQTVTGSNTSAIAIPDNNTTGVTRVINIATALTIQSVSATVNITHPYRGDIQIELISPAGTVATLKTTSNDSADNINATYTPTNFTGQNSAGNWTLRVKDLAASDTGTLNSWSISITGTTGGGTCTYSVSPTSVSATAAGGASSVSVTAGTGCAWTATSNAAWITTSASGSGNGTASFTVAANSGTTSRTGTLTVAGQTVTVTQAGNSGSQTVTGSNTSPIAIPDNNTTGVTRVINIATALTIQSVSVSVNITHTWRGDIQIELISPAGTTTVLKATSSGDSADNIVATYTPTTFTGQNSAGNWTLRVKDLASTDTGTLNNWSISITGTTSGAKASNDQASGVNPAQPWRRDDSTPLSVNRKGYSSPAILGYNGSK